MSVNLLLENDTDPVVWRGPIQSLATKFKDENQSIICRELLGLSVEKESYIPEERNEDYYKKRLV